MRALPDNSIGAALRAVDARVRPDFRRAVLAALLALVADAVAHGVGGVHAHALHNRVIAYVCAAGFLVFGVLATRSAAGELTRVSLHRAGPTAATPLRIACLLFGYLVVALAGLDLFAVPVGKLLVGGAVTGVILGIAAQQTLANVFAGLVLLFARPYIPGEGIRVRSGALGGTIEGTVTTVGLLYTTLQTVDGIVNIPNAGLLASAVGPLPAGAPAESGDSTEYADYSDDSRPADGRSSGTAAAVEGGVAGASGAGPDAR